MDGRFHTAATSFDSKYSGKLIKALNKEFHSQWNPITISGAPAVVQTIKSQAGGMKGGQILFTSDENSLPVIFGAWWPWGNGVTISLRIGLYQPGLSNDEIYAELTEHFEGLAE